MASSFVWFVSGLAPPYACESDGHDTGICLLLVASSIRKFPQFSFPSGGSGKWNGPGVGSYGSLRPLRS